MRWIVFNLSDFLRVPVIKHIKKRIFPELRGEIIVRDIPIPAKNDQSIPYTQLQCFSPSPDLISRLFDFIHKHHYSITTPILRLTTNKSKYHLRWNVPIGCNHRDIIHRWESWYLHNRYRRAINSIHTNNHTLRQYKNYLMLKLMNNHDCHSGNNRDFVDQDAIDGIQRYPFLQMYAPTVEPSNSSILRVRGLSIAFLNINGSAFNKIRSDHPYLFQLIKMHKIDIIAFIDTRYPTNPSWSIPGFTLVSRKSPINYPNNTIGGIMIYKRYNLTNKIKLFARPNRFDSLSISVSDTNDSTSLFSFKIAVFWLLYINNRINGMYG
eukprot:716983_1